MQGFSETDGDTQFAVGTVHGFRWWTINEEIMQWSLRIRLPEQSPLEPVTEYDGPLWTPLVPGEPWDHGKLVKPRGPVPPRPDTPGLLVGSQAPWVPGENHAGCLRHRAAGMLPVRGEEGHVAPQKGCHCGFWAYWDLHDAPHGNWDVAGVIEGYGKSTIGPLGFRVAKARIVALHLFTEIEGCDGKGRPVEDQSSAIEWKMDMEDTLARHYGLDRCWASLEAMAAAFPPNAQYASGVILDRARDRAAMLRAKSARIAAAMEQLKDSTADTRRKFDELVKLMEAGNDKKNTDPHGGS